MSGVIWVHKSEIDYATVVAQLRIEGKDFKGSIYFDAWHIDGEFVGLPRYWAENSGYVGNYSQVPTEWGDFKGKYRGNQEEKINQIVASIKKEKCTLFSAFPGWGKTVAGCSVAAKLGMKTLIIADQTDLLQQWSKSAADFFGVSTCVIRGPKWEESDCPLTVATIQTLAASGQKDRLLGKFGLTVIDEGHVFSTPSFHSVMPYLDSYFRLGVSATFRRADGLIDVLHKHMGNITVEAPREALRASYKAPLIDMPLEAKDYTTKGEINHAKMLTAIAELPEYNEWLAEIIKTCKEKGRKILLLSHRTDQCKIIHGLLTKKKIQSKIYVGSTKPKDKEEAEKLGIILSTYSKCQKGFDVPQLDTLILATPSSDVEQAVGRVIRKQEGKKNALVIDVVFNHPYLLALSRKRAAIYEKMGLSYEKN
jgi:superfamily II DNA or RNA helicase